MQLSTRQGRPEQVSWMCAALVSTPMKERHQAAEIVQELVWVHGCTDSLWAWMHIDHPWPRTHTVVPDVVFPFYKMGCPVSCFPETISIHFCAAITKWSVSIRSSTQVKISKFFQVMSHNLSNESSVSVQCRLHSSINSFHVNFALLPQCTEQKVHVLHIII